jgi:DNA-binding NarL/FixJ family response regulator
MVTLYVIEDHELIVQGIRHYLKRNHEIKFLGWASTIEIALNDFKKEQPDVILLDLFLRKKSEPISNFTAIRNELPQSKIIIFTGEARYCWQVKLMKEGAYAYIIKDCDCGYLEDTVLRVSKGEIVNPFDLVDHNGFALGPHDYDFLSKKDIDYIDYLSDGYTLKEISLQTGDSYSSIYNRTKALLNHYCARSHAELVRIFYGNS